MGNNAIDKVMDGLKTSAGWRLLMRQHVKHEDYRMEFQQGFIDS